MVAVLLADGFEEIEALSVVDILRRAEIEVSAVSIGQKNVVGGHGICVEADLLFGELDVSAVEMAVLPGGLLGVQNLQAFVPLKPFLEELLQNGKQVAAICAAPAALGAFGLLAGRKAICYPGMEEQLSGAQIVDDAVVCDGNLTTSKGPGTATVFGLTLVSKLKGEAAAKQVYNSMVCAAWNGEF